MKLLILSMLVASTLAAPAAQSLVFNDDGSYRFYYETGKEGGSHSRSEVRNPDGVVIGKFSYEDPDGELREVNYRADETGFIAQGDVGVKGAPKGQFPVIQEEEPQELTPSTTTAAPEEPEESKEEPQPNSEETYNESYHGGEEDHDDMQDLALEETSANDPPEGFPPGFFLQKFQGLRRLPEPTKEDKVPTTEAPQKIDEQKEPENTDTMEEKKEPIEQSTSVLKFEEASRLFPSLKPFPAYSPQEWASAMFHQPVYVFAYHQPKSYGYHYFF